MKNKILLLLTLAASFMLSSCNDYLSLNSENNTTPDGHFKDELTLQSAVDGMYAQFRSTLGSFNQNYRDRGMLLDNIGEASWKRLSQLDLTDYTAYSPEFSWIYEYSVISCTNLVIQYADKAGVSEEVYKNCVGQALAVRAYTYFQIIRLWGNAPLVLSYQDMDEKGRTPWREIADQIIKDLKVAIEYLPTEDRLCLADGTPVKDKQIPSKGTAYAILAHVYAWIAGFGQEPEYYAEGIKAAQMVISDPNYKLVSTNEEVCTKVLRGGSTESIFEVTYDYEKGEYKPIGSYIAGAVQRWPIEPNTTPNTRMKYYIRNSTVSATYPIGDKRIDAYFADFYNMSLTHPNAYIQMWRDIKTYQGGIYEGEPQTYIANDILITLADIILLKAEMEAATGNRSQAEADLNIIRKRAGIDNYSASDGDLRKAIQLERDREILLYITLMRYFDRMRNHTYNDLAGGYKTLTEQDVEKGALFLPVSAYAISNNPKTKQTAYWTGKI